MSLPPNRQFLKETRATNIFLETGIFRGDSIQQAIDAGFSKIIGIEISREMIEFCRDRFDNYQNLPQVQIFKGDSAERLYDIIKDINEPVTFFLDAHWQLFEGTERGKNPFPLIKELQQIGKMDFRAHKIIIDDFLYMTHPDVTGWSKHEIEQELYQVNQYFTFEYIGNPVENNMLIAQPCTNQRV